MRNIQQQFIYSCSILCISIEIYIYILFLPYFSSGGCVSSCIVLQTELRQTRAASEREEWYLIVHVRLCVYCESVCSKLSQVTWALNVNAQIPSFCSSSSSSMNKNPTWQIDSGRGSETRWEALKRKEQLCEKSTARGGVGTRLHCAPH